MPEAAQILPAEFVAAAVAVEGRINVGGALIPWGGGDFASVYVRRLSSDLSVVEIHIARHDGLAQEEMDADNEEADRYPLGPKEYWRTKMVGKYTYGLDAHPMTDAEFEQDWEDEE